VPAAVKENLQYASGLRPLLDNKKAGDIFCLIGSSDPVLPYTVRSVLKWLYVPDGTPAAHATPIPVAPETGVAVLLSTLQHNPVFIRPFI